jgi:serine/threonine-protein kinase
MSLDLGEQLLRTGLGSYALYAAIASGGFGTVYFGRDLQSNRPVAIKRLHGHLAYQPDVVERFQQEAQRLRGLQHPNIVQVLDDGTDGHGLPFIILEWVEGWTVAALLEKSGRFEIDEAVAIACQVLAALEAAGRRGVVHRDIKPSNLMLTPPPDRRVKVMDFGIAKDLLGNVGGQYTQIGTIAYMAPEQFTQGPVDARTDLYALGVTLYELLTGQRPSGALQPESPTSLRELRPEVDPALAAVVYRTLEKSPGDRFEDPTQMRIALEPFMGRGVDLAQLGADTSPAPMPASQLHVATLDAPPHTEASARAAQTEVVDRHTAPPRDTSPERRGPRPSGVPIWAIGAGGALGAVALLALGVVVAQQAMGGQTRQGTDPTPALVAPVARSTQLAPPPVVVAQPTNVPPTEIPRAVVQPTAVPTIARTATTAATSTSAPTVTPVATATPTVDDQWRVALAELDPTWARDWPKSIDLLSTFVAAHPGYAAGEEKLYAARLFYADELISAGDVDAAIAQLEAANVLRPLRPEANQTLVALTPTATAVPPAAPVAPASVPKPQPAAPVQQPRPAQPAPAQQPPPAPPPLRP